MPFKLLGVLALIVLVAILTGFNLSNKCTIWFFHTYENIPVFAAIVGAFIAGALTSIPFVIAKKNKKIRQLKEEGKKDKPSKLFGFKKDKKDKKETSLQTEHKTEETMETAEQ